MQARRGGVEAAVDGDRTGGQRLRQRRLIGSHGDQATPAEVVKDRGAPGDRVTGGPGDRIAGGPGNRVTGGRGDRLGGGPGDRVGGGPGNRVVGGPGDRVAGGRGDRFSGRPGDRVVGRAGRPSRWRAGRPFQWPAGRPSRWRAGRPSRSAGAGGWSSVVGRSDTGPSLPVVTSVDCPPGGDGSVRPCPGAERRSHGCFGT